MSLVLRSSSNSEEIERLFSLAKDSESGEEFSSLLQQQHELWHSVDAQGATLLHYRALLGDEGFVHRWLTLGMPLDVPCVSGQTPLMWAITQDRVRMCRVLLNARANPEHRDSQGATPFIISVQRKQFQVLLLLTSRVAPSILLRGCDANGRQAVHWAAYLGSIEGLRLLSYFDADFCALDNEGMSPLHQAVVNPQLENREAVFKLLLQSKVDANRKDYKGRTCMDLAHEELVKSALTKVMASRRSISSNAREYLCIRFVMRRIPKIFWLSCVCLCVLQFATDMRDFAWRVTPIAAFSFEIGTPIMLLTYAWSSCVNPGIVTPRGKGASGVEDIIDSIEGCDTFSDAISFERLCLTTWVVKGLRTKYDKTVERCVEEFDHLCQFLNAPVGRGNHRVFVLHCCAQTLVLWMGYYMCFRFLFELVTVQIGASPNVGSVARYWELTCTYPLLILVFFIYTGALLFVSALTCNQIAGIHLNLTVNEMINMKRYAHFWKTVETPSGKKRWCFTNPFDKGSVRLNILDFWWTRTRGQKGPETAASIRAFVLDLIFGDGSWWEEARTRLQNRRRSFDHYMRLP